MKVDAASSSANGLVIDVRDLPAPENILAVLKKVSELPSGVALEILIGSNPFQLYDLLQQRGYILNMILQKDGSYRGEVRRRS